MVSHPLLLSQGAYFELGEGDLWAGADLGLESESNRSCSLFCEAVCGRSGVAGALFRRLGRPLAGAGACACVDIVSVTVIASLLTLSFVISK